MGANHPVDISNTYLLWINGFHGINIDPLPESKKTFDRMRPKDINLNIGIASSNGQMTYYEFESSVYNTFSKKRAEKVVNNKMSGLKNKTKVKVERLEDVFDHYIGDTKIDVLNIDTESMELDVIKSNNWKKYRPHFIILESLGSRDVREAYTDESVRFLTENEYELVVKVFQSCFLEDKRYKETMSDGDY